MSYHFSMPKQKALTDADRLMAALSYVWILFVIPFVLRHDHKFVYNHAKQGMGLFVLEVILFSIGWFPIIGWFTAIIGWLFVAVSAVLGIAHALVGKEFKIPLLGKYLS